MLYTTSPSFPPFVLAQSKVPDAPQPHLIAPELLFPGGLFPRRPVIPSAFKKSCRAIQQNPVREGVHCTLRDTTAAPWCSATQGIAGREEEQREEKERKIFVHNDGSDRSGKRHTKSPCERENVTSGRKSKKNKFVPPMVVLRYKAIRRDAVLEKARHRVSLEALEEARWNDPRHDRRARPRPTSSPSLSGKQMLSPPC